MNSAVNELTRSVVDKNSIHDCTLSELEELTRQYPYFGPAQFLLAEKLKAENSPKYEQQSQKAILFFQDHLWFDYLSRRDDITATVSAATYTEPVAIKREQENKETQAEEERAEEKVVVDEQEVEEPVTGEIHVASEPVAIIEENIQPVIAEPEAHQQEVSQPEIQQQEITAPESIQHETGQAQHQQPEPAISQPELQQQDVPEPETQQTINVKPGAESTAHDNTDDPEPTPADNEPPIKLPTFKIEHVDLNKPLSFEPYHTVDYFASQGILFKEDDKPKDKFGRQLKSFTEWLKTMKKLPESENAAPPPAPEDQRVTQMAAHSITDSQVVTEAMADVWEKQGNHEKAIETYRKLSLLNPAKSAYFAAKIEQLKRQ